jgi:hypothetical protein
VDAGGELERSPGHSKEEAMDHILEPTVTCPRCGKERPVIIFGSGPIAVCDCDPWHVIIYEEKKP